jgi:hypothetical protein
MPGSPNKCFKKRVLLEKPSVQHGPSEAQALSGLSGNRGKSASFSLACAFEI